MPLHFLLRTPILWIRVPHLTLISCLKAVSLYTVTLGVGVPVYKFGGGHNSVHNIRDGQSYSRVCFV